jgi:hypothetical protein
MQGPAAREGDVDKGKAIEISANALKDECQRWIDCLCMFLVLS